MTIREEIRQEIEMYCTTVHPDNKKELLNVILYRVEKLIDSTEEEIKKHICDDEDSLIDYGVSELADKLREELEK